MQPYTIVFTINQKYIQHFCVTLTSILFNNPEMILDIYIAHSDLDNNDQYSIKKMFNQKDNISLLFVKIDDKIFKDFKVDKHASKENYFRILLPEIVPDTIQKILYLDCDVIVTGRIKQLFALDFKNDEYIYAVNNFLQEPVERLHKDFGFSEESSYFNSGVMLVNLNKWREDSIAERAITCAKENKDTIVWWDQDILNVLFENKWSELHPKFNYIHECMKEKKEMIHLSQS